MFLDVVNMQTIIIKTMIYDTLMLHSKLDNIILLKPFVVYKSMLHLPPEEPSSNFYFTLM